MGNPEDKQKRIQRRRNYIAKDLRTKKYTEKQHLSKEKEDKINIRNVKEYYDE